MSRVFLARSSPAASRVILHLERLGVEHELVCCDPSLAETAAFCAAYDCRLEDAVNAILVRSKDRPPRYALCLVLATDRLDLSGRLRGLLGERRVSLARPEEAEELTGMEIGGIAPFGIPEDLPVLVDPAVLDRPWLVFGGGGKDLKVLGPPALVEAVPQVESVEGLAAPRRLAGAGAVGGDQAPGDP